MGKTVFSPSENKIIPSPLKMKTTFFFFRWGEHCFLDVTELKNEVQFPINEKTKHGHSTVKFFCSFFVKFSVD